MRSLWLQEALAGEQDASVLEGDLKVDVCVVGGGYTGLWTALRIKELEPSLDVAVVEGDVCGGGASGRNGGFVLSWWAKFLKLKALVGADEARRLAQASADGVFAIGQFAAEHGIDAHYRADGWLWAATNRTQVGAWEETVRKLDQHGLRPFELLEPAEVRRRAGSAAHLAGVFERSAATVQPALLARGLRRAALGRGVRIFEHSPMQRLERSRPVRVHTPRGMVTAAQVVLALNAWAAGIPELRRLLLVVGSNVIATERCPERLAEMGWHNGMSISDSRLLVLYYRNTPDGRIVLGKGGSRQLAFGGRIGAHFEGPAAEAAAVTGHLHRLYPPMASVPIVSTWTGPVARTLSGVPIFGRLGGRPDLVYGAGYSGNGVGPAYIGGRILASLALGRVDEWSSCGLVRDRDGHFPPEPFRYYGGLMVRAAVARKERLEDAGRRPDWLTRVLAAQAPSGLVPLRKP